MEIYYLRELLLQTSTIEVGKSFTPLILVGYSRGGSSFDELEILRRLHVNNGSVLYQGYITWEWANILFWRTFFAITAHYLAVFIMLSIGLKKGFLDETRLVFE